MNPYLIAAGVTLAGSLFAQSSPEAGIPITDSLVIQKCGGCHARQSDGAMERISYSRATPEGWQDEIRRMVLRKGVELSPADARKIVKTLSTTQGLSPREAEPVLFLAERRVPQETAPSDDILDTACAKCHSIAVVHSWRREAEEWKQFVESHAREQHFRAAPKVIEALVSADPLRTSEWESWRAMSAKPSIAGRWLATARVPGRDTYYGEMQVENSSDGDFAARVTFVSAKDGSRLVRTGRATAYDGFAWRGRSTGEDKPEAPDDPAAEAREVMWFSDDGLRGEGRWYWGQYQEFGIDVRLERPVSGATILGVEPRGVKTGAQAAHIRLIGDQIPAGAQVADLNFGDGIAVRRIVSASAGEIMAEIDVAADAQSGYRDVKLKSAVLPKGMVVYDRVDYIKVVPESAVSSFGDASHQRGYVPLDAIGYQRGPDGRLHTADDVELGPVDVRWSAQIFHAADSSTAEPVATITRDGLFTPTSPGPGHNFDVWAIALAPNERDRNGQPLTGKAYVVVSPAVYTMNGRRYVRDLDRWKDDGPAEESKP